MVFLMEIRLFNGFLNILNFKRNYYDDEKKIKKQKSVKLWVFYIINVDVFYYIIVCRRLINEFIYLELYV